MKTVKKTINSIEELKVLLKFEERLGDMMKFNGSLSSYIIFLKAISILSHVRELLTLKVCHKEHDEYLDKLYKQRLEPVLEHLLKELQRAKELTDINNFDGRMLSLLSVLISACLVTIEGFEILVKFEEKLGDMMKINGSLSSYIIFLKATSILSHVRELLTLKVCHKENDGDLDKLYKQRLEPVLEHLLKELQRAEELTDNKNSIFIMLISELIGHVYLLLGQADQARNAFIEALGVISNNRYYRDMVMQDIIDSEKIMKDTWDNYTTACEYKDRKFIMPVKDNEIGGCVAEGINVFRTSNIPSCIKFPIGHPVANQLYIGHPYNPSLYVPFEESEDIFFVDKVHELCYLLECLGAENINITFIKGKNVSEHNNSQAGFNVDANVKAFGVEVSGKEQSQHQEETTSKDQRTMSIKFDPMRPPYLPEGLIWYAEQPQWQRLVNSRINGNMLEYNELISTSQTNFTSNSEKKGIKASAEYLWVKLHAEVEQNIETQFKETEETLWKVEVTFRSIKDFAVIDDTAQITTQDTKLIDITQMTNDEQSYAEEVKFCLEDGAIGDKERRFLERMRAKLGISPERAAEIEESLQKPQLTEDEQEYMDAVKDEIVDGKIPESSRRLLNRLKRSLDISDERTNEIEQYVLTK